MKKILKTVTVSGASDNTSISALKEIYEEFPFVEFGIPLSPSLEGNFGFPSLKWMEKLVSESFDNLSGHVCGNWVKNILNGKENFWLERPTIANEFKRIQLNFYVYVSGINISNVCNVFKNHPGTEFILQLKDENDELINDILKEGVVAFPLVHKSYKINGYHGIVGELGPDTLEEQLNIFEEYVDSPIWIDAERSLKTNNVPFDVKKVRKFLQIAEPWVIT